MEGLLDLAEQLDVLLAVQVVLGLLHGLAVDVLEVGLLGLLGAAGIAHVLEPLVFQDLRLRAEAHRLLGLVLGQAGNGAPELELLFLKDGA